MIERIKTFFRPAHSPLRYRPFTIPVAFVVTAESEPKAAAIVAEFLGVGWQTYWSEGQPNIESWHMPNHPRADLSEDNGIYLDWTVYRPAPQ